MLDGVPRIQERLDAVEQGRFARRRQSRQQRRSSPQPSSAPASAEPGNVPDADPQHEDHFVDLRI